jgi:hypothetical protein
MAGHPGTGFFFIASLVALLGSTPLAGAADPQPAPAVTVSAPLQRELIEWDEFTTRSPRPSAVI